MFIRFFEIFSLVPAVFILLTVGGLKGNEAEFSSEYDKTKFGAYVRVCQKASENDFDFVAFKRHPDYNDMLEHISQGVGQEYLDIIVNEHPELIAKFDICRQNDALGSPVTYKYGQYGAFSPTTLRYIKIAGDIKNRFDDVQNMHIVEIGAGYGGQCKVLDCITGFASYTIIDVPSALALAKKYLSRQGVKNVNFVEREDIDQTKDFDLVISNFALAEFDTTEQKKYIEQVIKGAPHGYIIWNMPFSAPRYTFEELRGLLGKQTNTTINKEFSRPWTAGSVCESLISWGSKEDKKKIITCSTMGQLGNQMFQVAAAVCFAFDNPSYEARCPDVGYEKILHRVNKRSLPLDSNFAYVTEKHPWQFTPVDLEGADNICLQGYFQSEKYFGQHKQAIVDLFAPTQDILTEIDNRYGHLLQHPTVAVHVRTFIPDGSQPETEGFRGVSWNYFVNAMNYFPAPNTHFLIFSDKPDWVKQHFPSVGRKCLFIENNSYYIDLYLMSLCQHQIVSPYSTFSWWGAYLNKNPSKMVVVPKLTEEYDLYPNRWIRME